MLAYLPIGTKGSKLIRNSTGKKCLLIGDKECALQIPKWGSSENLARATLADLPNDMPIALHTGTSNIIVIDFDDESFMEALQIDAELSPELQCTTIYKSVGKVGGHLVYRYENNKLTDFISNPNGKRLNRIDTLYGNSLVFASNEANTTKLVIKQSDTLVTMPLAIQQFVIGKYKTEPKKVIEQTNTSSKLGALAEVALKDEASLINLLAIITPARYKEILAKSPKDLFANHPDRLPDTESAHLYLVALSCVLMLDVSIDSTLYEKLVLYFNSLFSSPLDEARVKSIIHHDLHGGKFQYDSNWRETSFIVLSIDKHPIEVFMMSQKGGVGYVAFDKVSGDIQVYNTASALIDYLAAMTRTKIVKDRLIRQTTHIKLIDRPDKPFGVDYVDKTFNCYKRSAEQVVFYNPQDYKHSWSVLDQTKDYNENHPRYPVTTLKALENSVGGMLYTHFLPFIKRKLTTRDHSPLFFVFYGVPHSFKSAVLNGVLTHLVRNRHRTMSLEVICDKYNEWILDQDFILIDEVHHLTRYDINRLIKQINELSGNSTIAGVRRMHQSIDRETYPQEVTFMLTTNEAVQLTTEAADRRMVVFKSTSKVSEALGITNTQLEKKIKEETLDFAYYLATEVNPLYGDTYISNAAWKDESYKEFQSSALGAEDTIIKYLDDNKAEELFELFLEAGVPKEAILESTYEENDKYFLRLFNSKELDALVPALFTHTALKLDWKIFKKKLQLVPTIRFRLNEYADGVYVNKKTDYVIPPEASWLADVTKVGKIDLEVDLDLP